MCQNKTFRSGETIRLCIPHENSSRLKLQERANGCSELRQHYPIFEAVDVICEIEPFRRHIETVTLNESAR